MPVLVVERGRNILATFFVGIEAVASSIVLKMFL